MSDICEYLVHEVNENRSQLQVPCGPISFAIFQAPWSQSTTLTLGKKKHTDHMKHEEIKRMNIIITICPKITKTKNITTSNSVFHKG